MRRSPRTFKRTWHFWTICLTWATTLITFWSALGAIRQMGGRQVSMTRRSRRIRHNSVGKASLICSLKMWRRRMMVPKTHHEKETIRNTDEIIRMHQAFQWNSMKTTRHRTTPTCQRRPKETMAVSWVLNMTISLQRPTLRRWTLRIWPNSLESRKSYRSRIHWKTTYNASIRSLARKASKV